VLCFSLSGSDYEVTNNHVIENKEVTNKWEGEDYSGMENTPTVAKCFVMPLSSLSNINSTVSLNS
jgi:hypothetical protein